MKRFLVQSWGLILLIIAWQVWVSATGFNAIVMPAPLAVLEDLGGNPGASRSALGWRWPPGRRASSAAFFCRSASSSHRFPWSA
jgi:ABC-type nitrate/sulfonate/bicarbonate transport system permease component